MGGEACGIGTSDDNLVEIQGFNVIQLKFCEKSKSSHCLYLKEHAVRESDVHKPRDKTLFVLNVPPYCTEESLRRVFGVCGKILHVYLHDKPSSGLPPKNSSEYFPSVETFKGFRVAYIVFKSPKSVEKAKQLPYNKPLILSTDQHPVLHGVRKWISEYRVKDISTTDLQQEVDSYMEEYDRKKEEEEKKAKEMEGIPDDEGWVTVTRHSKSKVAPYTEAQANKVTSKERKRRKEKELLNFYAFQIRDGKREQIASLRKKFEEDKQRIAIMKASRKFRPY